MKMIWFIPLYSSIILNAAIPGWASFLYYIFFIVTILAAFVAIFQKKVMIELNIVTILLPFIMHVVFLFYGIGRPFEYDEFQWLLIEFGRFKVWAFFIIISYGYLIFWWYEFIGGNDRKATHT